MGIQTIPVAVFNANSAMNEQQFTSSGTFTPATGVNKVQVLLVSGGGGSGKTSSGYMAEGGNGGAMTSTQLTVTPGTSYTVTVGAGGPTAASGGQVGSQGSSSVFGSTTVAGGQGGGYAGSSYVSALANFAGKSSYGPGSTGGNAAANTGGGGGSAGYAFGNGGSGIVIVRWLA
jgi:hypothetical protein